MNSFNNEDTKVNRSKSIVNHWLENNATMANVYTNSEDIPQYDNIIEAHEEEEVMTESSDHGFAYTYKIDAGNAKELKIELVEEDLNVVVADENTEIEPRIIVNTDVFTHNTIIDAREELNMIDLPDYSSVSKYKTDATHEEGIDSVEEVINEPVTDENTEMEPKGKRKPNQLYCGENFIPNELLKVNDKLTKMTKKKQPWQLTKCPCSGCIGQECGKCKFCKDKPKNGGPNTLKKRCMERKCEYV